MDQPVGKHECLACGHTDYRMTNSPIGELFEESCPKCEGDMLVQSRGEIPEKLETVKRSVDEHFKIWDFKLSVENMEFLVESDDQKKSFSNLLDDLRNVGYIARLVESRKGLSIQVEKSPEVGKSNVWINVGLLFATIATTFGVAGYWFLYGKNVLNAALFSLSLMTVLAAHELGHKISAWKNRVEASWPYFIPIPHPFIGTLGAVIKNKSPIPSREALAELGASGPLLGFFLAIPITFTGLIFSQPTGGETFLLGHSVSQSLPMPLIYILFEKSIFGYIPTALSPHPLAWSGFIILLVTWLNLLPTGQLDGGHIARSLLNQNKHFILTRTIGFALLFLSLIWNGFLILALFILFIVGNPHPGALDNVSKLKNSHKILAVSSLIVFILCFPIPLWIF